MKDTRRWAGKRIGVIAAGERSVGGADRFYDSLSAGLAELGCDVEVVRVPARESSFQEIVGNYEFVRSLDLSRFDAVISTKAPTYAVQHPRHIVYLVHTIRVFDDMFERNFPHADITAHEHRRAIHDLDFEGFREARAIYCIGGEVRRRLYRKFGIDSRVIHPPLGPNEFRRVGDNGSFLILGRLHPWKRVDLAIRAVKESSRDLRLDIVGTGEAEGDLKALADGDPRIRFLGTVSDEEATRLYGQCRAVVFVPEREDYGYVTLEAFASGKPVITCHDSGETNHFVRTGETGLVVSPDPDSIASAMALLAEDAELAERLGVEGQSRVSAMSWSSCCEELLSAAFTDDAVEADKPPLEVTALDMQPIHPPVGGGRLRLLGVYHDLGPSFATTYVGSFDWPGEQPRELKLSPSLREIDVPLSPEHHAAAADMQGAAGGKVVIDLAFTELSHLSPDFAEAARTHVATASAVFFSHPWVYPIVKDVLHPGQLVVYDSQNVEVFLRRQIIDVNAPFERRLLEAVARDEYEIVRESDIILACSHEDARRFTRIYDVNPGKIRVVPNGVMASKRLPATPRQMEAARKRLGLPEGLIAVFVGSAYGPNVEAACFIIDRLAPANPETCFVIAGGAGEQLAGSSRNVRVTGRMSAEELDDCLSSADIAINPMFSGSGTNIKMFDFMAAALPVVSTATGARGIDCASENAIVIAEGTVDDFSRAICQLKDTKTRARIGQAARRVVEQSYSWEVISRNVGHLTRNWLASGTQTRPLFSVVIPTYERPRLLRQALSRLASQVEVDFEVVVVDQSEEPAKLDKYGFELTHIHTPIKGAISARNLGAFVAKGDVVAFMDDDCLPDPGWLVNARHYFADRGVVGVEGLIHSDHLGDPDWRPVSNVGFEGIGFMSANLLVRQGAFQRVGGFDLRFDNPHFREDTDLGWRLQELGSVPYADDVSVFHPAHPRDDERESLASRNKFYVKDAYLCQKHPERYKELFNAERLYENPAALSQVIKGFELSDIDFPDWMRCFVE